MKVRLNESSREQLRRLARELVRVSIEEAARDVAYTNAETLVRALVEKDLPPKDMEVLKKYEAARVDDCIRLSAGDRFYTVFRFSEGAGPLSVNCRTFLMDDITRTAVEVYDFAVAAYNDALKAKLMDYYALINGSRYLEDVINVWPEAERIRSSLGFSAVSILSAEALERIRADVKERVG